MQLLDFAALQRTPSVLRRPLPPIDCEYTAPGSKTEAIDCWEAATYRYVTDEGITKLLLCDAHRGRGVPRSLTEEKMAAS